MQSMWPPEDAAFCLRNGQDLVYVDTETDEICLRRTHILRVF